MLNLTISIVAGLVAVGLASLVTYYSIAKDKYMSEERRATFISRFQNTLPWVTALGVAIGVMAYLTLMDAEDCSIWNYVGLSGLLTIFGSGVILHVSIHRNREDFFVEKQFLDDND